MLRLCEQCGASFQTYPCRVRKGNGQFCSVQCSRKAHSVDAYHRPDGYVTVLRPGHPNADSVGRVYQHVLVAEQILGRPLQKGEVVHHLNHDPSDNRPDNLRVCKDQAEHLALHAQERLVQHGGRPMLEKRCHRCQQIKPLSEFSPSSSHGRRVPSSRCKPCAVQAQRERRQRSLKR